MQIQPTPRTQPPQTPRTAGARYLFLIKTQQAGSRRYEVRQYPSAVDAVLDALLRHGVDCGVAVRPLGGAL